MQCWLVERDYDDKGLIRLVYATEDGARRLISERSPAMLRRDSVTAAIDVPSDRLEPVADPDTRDRYASAVSAVRARHDPDDPV